MDKHRNWGGDIRKLWSVESEKLRDHLLRLDPASRRLRFGHAVSDAVIKDYASRIRDTNAVIYGYFEGQEMHAAAELRKAGTTWGKEAEAAFSVEQPYQELGIGTELMGRVIRAARNRGVHVLNMICLADNARMQRIARRHNATLRFEHGDIRGRIVPLEPSALSLMEEAVDDQCARLMAVLDLQAKLMPSVA